MIKFIVCSPKEDSYQSVGINYHCDKEESFVLYKKEEEKGFNRVKVLGTLWSTKGLYNASQEDGFTIDRYVCKLDLCGLDEDTKYEFFVKCNDEESEIYRFKTSKKDRFDVSWSFNAYVDFQHRGNAFKEIIISKMMEMYPDNNLSLCSGDMIDVATYESSWDWFFNSKLFKSGLYFSTPGDHEYWGMEVNHHYPQLKRPDTYNALFNNPKNGLYKNSNYYLYYNNVLFIGLDMNDSDQSRGEFFDNEAKWLDDTLTRLEKSADYIIVIMHKAIYGSYYNDSGVVRNIRPLFAPVIEKHKVDLVFSGHDHMYSRTYPLYMGKMSNEGTYYLDMGSSGDKRRLIDQDLYTDGLHECVLDIKTNLQTLASHIEVGKELMKVTCINYDGCILDSFEISKKVR